MTAVIEARDVRCAFHISSSMTTPERVLRDRSDGVSFNLAAGDLQRHRRQIRLRRMDAGTP